MSLPLSPSTIRPSIHPSVCCLKDEMVNTMLQACLDILIVLVVEGSKRPSHPHWLTVQTTKKNITSTPSHPVGAGEGGRGWGSRHATSTRKPLPPPNQPLPCLKMPSFFSSPPCQVPSSQKCPPMCMLFKKPVFLTASP